MELSMKITNNIFKKKMMHKNLDPSWSKSISILDNKKIYESAKNYVHKKIW